MPADRLVIGFPAPALADRDRAAYEVPTEILAGGPSSRLYRTLVVDKQWASSVRGDVAPTRDPGLLRDLGADDEGAHRRAGRDA